MSNILLVDDQDSWQKLLKTLLEMEGLDVLQAKNYEDAEKIIKSELFDLAVLDIRLVDEESYNIDGLRVLELIKLKTNKIIILSGYLDGIRNIEKLNISLLLEKGNFNYEYFIQEVNRLLLN